ncbi:MAG: IS5 family transposase [Gammaproteobacteria bacterium]|nr:IS5 family transposase [Gammaproteobacteria bacterium]MYF54060.1 IS5 family transposase [Gammaproteobacteria bacterium]MYK42787.1 IS5 family transposase [Gammaproteobacteria bacterium]
MTREISSSESDCFVASEITDALSQVKETMLERLDRVVDWERFRVPLGLIWTWTGDDGRRGRPSWDAVQMFKVLVYGKCHGNLSEASLEDHCSVNLRVKRFVGLGLKQGPDAKTIHKYRSVLAHSGRMVELFDEFISQLTAKGYRLAEGTLIDASLIAAPVQRKLAPSAAAELSGEADQPPTLTTVSEVREANAGKEAQHRQQDREARWVKRQGHAVFGYKDHVVADTTHKFIWASGVTPANVHDSQVALGLLEKVPIPTKVDADRGYDSVRIRSGLTVLGHEPCIAARAPTRGHETKTAKSARITTNQKLSRTRVRVEHIFGTIKHDMGCRLHRGIGLARAESEIFLQNLVYNMRRLVSVEAKLKP